MAALTFTGSDGGESSCGCFAAHALNKPVAGNSIAAASQAGIRVLTIDVCLPVVPRLGASDSVSVEYASGRVPGKPGPSDRLIDRRAFARGADAMPAPPRVGSERPAGAARSGNPSASPAAAPRCVGGHGELDERLDVPGFPRNTGRRRDR
jgi:hypothetical protein